MASPKFKVRKGDSVVVIAGKHRGSTGVILKVLPSKDRVVVEGVNLVKRHQKANGDQPGQIVTKEAAIHVSNVAFWNEAEKRRVKVGYSFDDDGNKIRIDRKSGVAIA
jgi:large subunit ribosomal protein L24